MKSQKGGGGGDENAREKGHRATDGWRRGKGEGSCKDAFSCFYPLNRDDDDDDDQSTTMMMMQMSYSQPTEMITKTN